MLRMAYAAADDEFMNQLARRRAGHYPAFPNKTAAPDFLVIKDTRYHNLSRHILDVLGDAKMVAIVRHPCGAIHSWLANPREFPAGADPKQQWRSGACRKTGPEEFWGFEDWKKVTRLHLDLEKCFPKRFRIVRYEDLVAEPEQQTQRIFDFVRLPYTAQTKEFLAVSQRHNDPDPYAVFKMPETKDRWKRELDPEIQTAILNEVRDTELSRFLV